MKLSNETNNAHSQEIGLTIKSEKIKEFRGQKEVKKMYDIHSVAF